MSINYYFRFTLFLLVCPINVFSQFVNVQIDNVGNPEEPSIAINPKNTNQIVAGANIDNQYYSHDGGQTWTKQQLVSSWGVWGDPCIVTDSSGRFYFFHLAYTNGPNGWIDRIVCQRSDDAGLTWPVESYTGLNNPKDQDKEWAVYDAVPASPYKGTMYVTWTEFDSYGSPNPVDRSRILFSKSTDHGVTWSAPITISQFAGDCIDEDNTAEGAVPAVGANGEIFVSWSLNDTLYFDRSTDGGVTWLANDIVAATQPGGWDITIPGHDRANGLPVTCTDLSNGTFHGTIYINWCDQRNGAADTDVWLVKSTDGGNTWTLPIRVNNDPPGKQNYLTWMTVDQATGSIYFVFYDRRNHSNNQTDVYLAYSNDGGATFTNVKASTSPFTPTSNAFFGDYSNITAHDGHVRPIWARMDNSVSSVWTALADFPTGIDTENYFGLNSTVSNFPNPFSGQTTITFSVFKTQNLSLDIFDMDGKRRCSIFSDKTFLKGSHEIVFNTSKNNLPAGVYAVRLSSEAYQECTRMIVLK